MAIGFRLLASFVTVAALAVALAAGARPAGAEDRFAAWVTGVRAEAKSMGVSDKTLDGAFKGLKPDPRVVKLDRKQPEFTMTFEQYLSRVVTRQQVAKGRKRFEQNRAMLDEVSARYGVPPQVIVALWGVETKYGTRTGDFDIIRSLATLAYDGRRSKFFRKELMAALQILDEGHISRADMRGSWAGAMGQSQFMPTSFRAYAVDHTGDGRRDIWGTKADVFASAANYLASHGWKAGQRWGRPVTLPEKFDASTAGRETRKKVSTWKQLGVVVDTAGGDPMASVILPDGAPGPAYFAYHNFNVIRRWNPSNFFALAVGLLSDQIIAK